MIVVFYSIFALIIHWQLSHFVELVENLHTHPMRVNEAALTASRDIFVISRNLRDMLLTKDTEILRNLLSQIQQYEVNIEQNMNLALSRMDSVGGQALVLKALQELRTQKPLRQEVTEAIFAGDLAKAQKITREQGLPLVQRLENNFVKIADFTESESMRYHIHSINDFDRAKVLLLTSGIIILLLSLTFAIFAWYSLKNAIEKIKRVVTTAEGPPIHVDLNFAEPSPANIAVTLNHYFSRLHDQIVDIDQQFNSLNQDITDLKNTAFNVPVAYEQVSNNIEQLIKLVEVVAATTHDKEDRRTPFDILQQIKAELAVLMNKSNQLEKLDMSKHSQRCLHLLDVLNDLLAVMLQGMVELRAASFAYHEIIHDLNKLRTHSEHCAQKVAAIRDKSQIVDHQLKGFALTTNDDLKQPR